MDLVISNGEFQRLSESTQRELLGVLTGSVPVQYEDVRVEAFEVDPFVEVPLSSYSTDAGSSDPAKRVIGITTDQAAELLANLADRSQQTLRLFAVAGHVGINELVGEEAPYRDMNELKRSFVGAVNRRLRTVVGNRSVVLFSSDRDRRRIRVLPHAAAALRQAMGIPEMDIGEAFEEIEPVSEDMFEQELHHQGEWVDQR